jgi:hypothetical protein
MLCRWKKADKWDDVSRALRRGRVWCIKIYRQLFSPFRSTLQEAGTGTGLQPYSSTAGRLELHNGAIQWLQP